MNYIKKVFLLLKFFLKKKIKYIFNLKSYNEKNLEDVFKSIITMEISVDLIIDVGAYKGNWSSIANKYFKDAELILVEPNPILFKDLNQTFKIKNSTIINYAVSNYLGKKKFMISIRDDSSRLIESNKVIPNDFSKFIYVNVSRLDNLIKNFNDKNILLKIDAEGQDLNVLEGSKKLLQYCSIIFIEAAVLNFEFRNNFYKVINYMKSKNFSLMGISDLNKAPKNRILWLAELCFVNNKYLDNKKINFY